MATPFEFTGPGLERIGIQWMDCLDGRSERGRGAQFWFELAEAEPHDGQR